MTFRPANIMFIEDNDDHALLTIDCLRNEKIVNRIDRFSNGESALGCLFDERGRTEDGAMPFPDLILCDIQLPGISGLEVLKRIKSNSKTKRIPVIILTTSKREEEISLGYEWGANSYIVKPINFDEFRKKLTNLKMYWVLTSEFSTA